MVPPSYSARRLRCAYGWPGGEKIKRGGGFSPTTLLVVFYNVQFNMLYLIYVYMNFTFTILHSVQYSGFFLDS